MDRNAMFAALYGGNTGRGVPQQQGMGDALADLAQSPQPMFPGGHQPSDGVHINPDTGARYGREAHPEARDPGHSIVWGPGTQQPLIGGNFLNDPGLTGVPTFTPDPTPPPLTPDEVTRQQRQQPQPEPQDDRFLNPRGANPGRDQGNRNEPDATVKIDPIEIEGYSNVPGGPNNRPETRPDDFRLQDVPPPDLQMNVRGNPTLDTRFGQGGPLSESPTDLYGNPWGTARTGRGAPIGSSTYPDALPLTGSPPPMTDFRDLYNPRQNYIPGVDPLPPSQWPSGPLQYTPGGRGGYRLF